jgi:hypothetical protein
LITFLINSQKFMHHIDEEEQKFLNNLAAALGDDEMEKLGRPMDEARATAPTRPHPMAPDHPPFATIVAAIEAPIDRLRDKLEGRQFLDSENKPAEEPKKAN